MRCRKRRPQPQPAAALVTHAFTHQQITGLLTLGNAPGVSLMRGRKTLAVQAEVLSDLPIGGWINLGTLRPDQLDDTLLLTQVHTLYRKLAGSWRV